MASKPKTGSTKKEPASASDKEVQKTQRERFIETARELGSDETGKLFDRAFSNLTLNKGKQK